MSKPLHHSQGNPGESVVCVFSHPLAQVNKRLLGPFIQVLHQGTDYTQHVDKAPLRSDCITSIKYIAERALQAPIFPTDPSIKITSIAELPPHMIANGWKARSIFLHEVLLGDVILVAKIGSTTLTHAAMFLSQQNIFHVNHGDGTGVTCSVREFQEVYDIYLTRDQIFNPTTASYPKKRKTLSDEPIAPVNRPNSCPDLAGSALPIPRPLLRRGATDFNPKIATAEPLPPVEEDEAATQKV